MSHKIRAFAGIAAGAVGVAAIAIATHHSIHDSRDRQEQAETVLIQDHADTAAANRQLALEAKRTAETTAADKAAAYEKIPEIQVLRALEAEDRRAAQRPRSPTPIPAAAH